MKEATVHRDPSVDIPVAGRWVPELQVVFLPRCPKCHAPHPQARNPKIDGDTCPDCGAPVPKPGDPVVTSPKIGFLIWVANACQAIARWLLKFSERN